MLVKFSLGVFSVCSSFVWGDRGGNSGLKGAGSLWEAVEERVVSGIPKVVGTGRNSKNVAILHNILQ